MKTATVWLDAEKRRLAVKTPFDAGLVANWKQQIPAPNREWDNIKKIWLFDLGVSEVVEGILKGLGYTIHDGTLPHENQLVEQASKLESPYHDLICNLSLEALTKVYRIAAMDLHPDRTHDEEKFKKLQVAWAKLQKEKEERK